MPYKDKTQRLKCIADWQLNNADKVKAYKQKWKENNRERCREYYRQGRRDVLSHYSDGKLVCACCGESTFEFLCIDHINGGGTKHRKSLPHHDIYRHLISENFPPGYRVLCHNCNHCYGHYGYCPHQKDHENSKE